MLLRKDTGSFDILLFDFVERESYGVLLSYTLNQRGPAYLNNIIKFNTEESGRRHLSSSTTNTAVVMRARTQFGKRAFSVCGPCIWNQIPPLISNLHSVPAFRKALKT